MDPTFMFGDLDPTNWFAMEGLNMAFTAELTHGRKTFAKTALHRYHDWKNPNVGKPS